MKTGRGSGCLTQLGRVLVRALLAAALLWLVLSIPLPRATPRFWAMVEVPLAVFVFILYLGKLLFDTFFYDHYPR